MIALPAIHHKVLTDPTSELVLETKHGIVQSFQRLRDATAFVFHNNFQNQHGKVFIQTNTNPPRFELLAEEHHSRDEIE